MPPGASLQGRLPFLALAPESAYREKRTIQMTKMKSQGSLTALWCFFRLAFLRNTHCNINKQVDKHLIYNVSVYLPLCWTASYLAGC